MKRFLMMLAVSMFTSELVALTLSEQAEAKAAIVLPDSASPSERKAAEELREVLRKVTGADFAIGEQPAGEGMAPIYVGGLARLTGQFPELKGKVGEGDGIVISITDDRLVLAGATPRATLYAVYEFLQSMVGCDWWTATAASLPSKPTLEVSNGEVAYTPPLIYRDIYEKGIVDSPRFSVQMRRNGGTGERPGDQVLPAEWGGSLQIAGHTHTFDKFLPAAEYFEAHPEWGALIGGERRSWSQHGGQPCLSNAELLAAMQKKVLEQVDLYPHARMISVSMNDNTYRCECGPCLAIEEEEGALSGPLIRFVNAVAEEVHKKDPHLLVETLAYFYTISPPKITRPADNVIIRLTTYTDEHLLPFEKNALLKRKIEGWAAISKQLFIWDYQPDFHESWKARPNLLQMAENIRYMIKNGARGYFMESELRPTDFNELRVWLAAQLLWNPAQDEQALLKRFLKGYYGAAAEPLRSYLEVMHKELPLERASMTGFGISRLPYTAKTLNKASALMAKAKASVAESPEELLRVRKEALALDYLRLVRYPELPDAERIALFATVDDARAAVEAFRNEVEALGIPSKQSGFGLNPHDVALATDYLRHRLTARNDAITPPEGEKPGVVIPAVEFALWGYGSNVFFEDDEAAETGVVAALPLKGDTWAVQVDTLPVLKGRRWKAFVRLKVTGEGTGKVSIGNYRRQQYATLFQRSFTLKPSDRYQTFPLGEVNLIEGDYFYVTPTAPFNEAAKVLVSQFYFVPVED